MSIFGPMVDTRLLFPREREELLELLGSLHPTDWSRATICPGWNVHDVVGHLLNDYLRRLSGSRDGFAGAVFANDETLPSYLARINDEFVRATRQCSPKVMVELLAYLGPQLDQTWAAADLNAPADTDVSWAAPDIPSPAWLDIAREFTEFWVHQQQIRDTVGRPGAQQPELLHPVLDTFLRALPHALRGQARPGGTIVRFTVTGAAGGRWHAVRASDRWRMASTDTVTEAAAQVTMDQDDLWRLASRGITPAEGRRRAVAEGDPALINAATSLLAVIA
ncbi:MAG: maleylpyruvate isomerase family mycothiol-dependent enzyme [Pseudonocardiaceae bacterium]